MKMLRRRNLLTGFGAAILIGSLGYAEEEEDVTPIPVSVPVSAEVREIVEDLMAKHDLTLFEFIQFFGIIVYDGSELSFHEERSVIVGKLAHSQGLLLVHLASMLSEMRTEKAIRHYLDSVLQGGCEFCGSRYASSFFRIASTS